MKNCRSNRIALSQDMSRMLGIQWYGVRVRVQYNKKKRNCCIWFFLSTRTASSCSFAFEPLIQIFSRLHVLLLLMLACGQSKTNCAKDHAINNKIASVSGFHISFLLLDCSSVAHELVTFLFILSISFQSVFVRQSQLHLNHSNKMFSEWEKHNETILLLIK